MTRPTIVLTSFLLIVAALPAIVPSADAATAPAITYVSKNGNEWWVEARIGGADASQVVAVHSRDSYGAYVPLQAKAWGSWAASYHVEPGHLVKFRVILADGRMSWSCAFAHPSGEPRCGVPVPEANASQPAPTPAPAPASGLTFASKNGNEWWVEARLGGPNATKVAKVEARDSHGDFVQLQLRSWGGYAASFRVEPGHLVLFRATMNDGRTTTSCAFEHPSGVERCDLTVPASTPAPAPSPTPSPTPAPSGKLAHTGIVATTFWVGELYDATLEDGSQVCSTYDAHWAYHWSGVDQGRVPAGAAGCAGSIIGGCDGIPGPNHSCKTERRTAANGYFPTSPQVTPKENPFYLDLPYDDLNDRIAFAERCSVIPWANDPGFVGRCKDTSFSYMKNHWVKLIGPNGSTCYGQIQDAGPSSGTNYHDKAYVFGKNDERPAQTQWNNAGMDVSPALNGCLGFKDLDGSSDKVSWEFVDADQVPAGPWTRIITTRQVTN